MPPIQYADSYDGPVEDTGGVELTTLTGYAIDLEDLDEKIRVQQERLDELNKVRTHLSEVVIPDALDALGLGDELALKDGGTLVCPAKVTAGISKERQRAAHAWLREKGFGALIKRKVTLQFGRGQDNQAGAVIDDLRKQGLTPEDKEEVHHSTLGAFVRKQLEEGAELPLDLFGVNRRRRADVIRTK